MFHLTLDGLRRYNIVKDKELADFHDKIHEKSDPIPFENRDDSKAGLALKAMEDSRYQLNEETMRELFANLISSTLDNRKNNKIVPVFSHILANITKEDAQFLKLLNENGGALPLVQIAQYEESGKSIVPYKNIVLTKDDYSADLRKSLEALSMFEIISVEPKASLGSKEYIEIYSSFKKSDLYTHAENSLPKEISGFTFTRSALIEGRVILTTLGIDFVNIVFQD